MGQAQLEDAQETAVQRIQGAYKAWREKQMLIDLRERIVQLQVC